MLGLDRLDLAIAAVYGALAAVLLDLILGVHCG